MRGGSGQWGTRATAAPRHADASRQPLACALRARPHSVPSPCTPQSMAQAPGSYIWRYDLQDEVVEARRRTDLKRQATWASDDESDCCSEPCSARMADEHEMGEDCGAQDRMTSGTAARQAKRAKTQHRPLHVPSSGFGNASFALPLSSPAQSRMTFPVRGEAGVMGRASAALHSRRGLKRGRAEASASARGGGAGKDSDAHGASRVGGGVDGSGGGLDDGVADEEEDRDDDDDDGGSSSSALWHARKRRLVLPDCPTSTIDIETCHTVAQARGSLISVPMER